MCGFIGVFGKADNRVKEFGNTILHRGPDMQKYTSGADWAVQFNRLAILDLSIEGMQPFRFEGVEVFINGEIYNYLELLREHKNEFQNKTSCDAEIVPFLFRKYGMNFLNKINGMFSMVIIDHDNKKNYLVKDRYGKKPLFFSNLKGCLYFSSELKSLKSLLNSEIDRTNININLISNFIIPPITPFKNLFSLMPGHFIEWKNNEFKKINWYKPNIEESNINNKNVKEVFEKLTNNSIDLRLRSDVPIGVFLSGGLDSNFILKKTFSKNKDITALICKIADKEKINKNIIDNTNPEKVCKELRCKSKIINFDYSYLNQNLIKIIKAHDELITNSGVLIFYALSEEAKKNNIKVVLTGAGGDELAGGYYWQKKLNYVPNIFYDKDFKSLNLLEKLIKLVFFKKNKYLLKIYKLYQLIFKPENYHIETHGSNLRVFLGEEYFKSEKKIKDLYKSFYNISENVFKRKKRKELIDYNNTFLTISTQNFIFDMMTMAHSIENRSPFLDFQLFEFMNSLPKKIRNKDGLKSLYKSLLKEYLPEYVVKSQKSGPNLPLQFWFNSRPDVKKKVFLFIKKNSHYIEKNISNELAINIKNDKIFKFDKNLEITFKLLCLIIWLKINNDDSFNTINISLEEFLEQ